MTGRSARQRAQRVNTTRYRGSLFLVVGDVRGLRPWLLGHRIEMAPRRLACDFGTDASRQIPTWRQGCEDQRRVKGYFDPAFRDQTDSDLARQASSTPQNSSMSLMSSQEVVRARTCPSRRDQNGLRRFLLTIYITLEVGMPGPFLVLLPAPL